MPVNVSFVKAKYYPTVFVQKTVFFCSYPHFIRECYSLYHLVKIDTFSLLCQFVMIKLRASE